MLGLKSNYIIVIVITVYYLVKKNRSKGGNKNKLIMFLAVCIGMVSLYYLYYEQIKIIYNRWIYFSSVRSFSSFITSSRLDGISSIFAYIRENYSALYFIVGTGLGYTKAIGKFVEMDFFDIYFQFGCVGFIFILSYYFSLYFRNRKRENNKEFYNCAFLMAMVISALAGHVLESALSGMFFSMICCGLITNKNCVNLNKKIKR